MSSKSSASVPMMSVCAAMSARERPPVFWIPLTAQSKSAIFGPLKASAWRTGQLETPTSPISGSQLASMTMIWMPSSGR
jgi:hypothetical protein